MIFDEGHVVLQVVSGNCCQVPALPVFRCIRKMVCGARRGIVMHATGGVGCMLPGICPACLWEQEEDGEWSSIMVSSSYN